MRKPIDSPSGGSSFISIDFFMLIIIVCAHAFLEIDGACHQFGTSLNVFTFIFRDFFYLNCGN